MKDEGYLSCEFCNHGNLVAVADQCGYAYVYELCMPLPKLSQFCRNVIRKNLVKEKNNATIDSVNELYCIPKSVKSFLSYDSCTWALIKIIWVHPFAYIYIFYFKKGWPIWRYWIIRVYELGKFWAENANRYIKRGDNDIEKQHVKPQKKQRNYMSNLYAVYDQ